MMETDAFRIEEDAARHIATVRFSRGGSGNKLLASEMPALGQAIRRLGSAKNIRLVLVKGEGAHFCQGRAPDPAGKAPTTALGIRAGVTEPILDVYADIRATPGAGDRGRAGRGQRLRLRARRAMRSRDCRGQRNVLVPGTRPPSAADACDVGDAAQGDAEAAAASHLYAAHDWGGRSAVARAVERGRARHAISRARRSKTIAALADRNRAALAGVKEYLNTALYIDPAWRLAACRQSLGRRAIIAEGGVTWPRSRRSVSCLASPALRASSMASARSKSCGAPGSRPIS